MGSGCRGASLCRFLQLHTALLATTVHAFLVSFYIVPDPIEAKLGRYLLVFIATEQLERDPLKKTS